MHLVEVLLELVLPEESANLDLFVTATKHVVRVVKLRTWKRLTAECAAEIVEDVAIKLTDPFSAVEQMYRGFMAFPVVGILEGTSTFSAMEPW
jgi:hypothetical protein